MSEHAGWIENPIGKFQKTYAEAHVDRLNAQKEAQARTIEKLQAKIKTLEAGLHVCSGCGKPTARPYTIGSGIVTCKGCRSQVAKKLKGS